MRMIYPSLFIPTFADNAEHRLRLLRMTKFVNLFGLLLYVIQLFVLENCFYFVESYANLITIVHQNNFDLFVFIILLYVFRPTKDQYTFTDEMDVIPNVILF